MSTEPDLQALWQAQPTSPQELDMIALQEKSDAFVRTIRRRNERDRRRRRRRT